MELHVLHRHGWSISALAREFGLNWRTARRYATAPAAPHYPARVRPAELTPAQLAHVERRLAAYPGLRGTVLLRELRELGYTASVASLRRRLRILRPAAMAEPEVRFETGSGIQSQGDWTDCGTWPLGDGSTGVDSLHDRQERSRGRRRDVTQPGDGASPLVPLPGPPDGYDLR